MNHDRREDRLLDEALAGMAVAPPSRERLERLWAAIEPAALSAARRQRRHHRLQGLVSALAGRSWPRRTLVLAGAAALLVLLPWWLAGRRAGPPPADPARPLTLTVAQGGPPALARLRSGATVALLRGSAEIDQRDRHQARVALHKGTVELRVPPLPAGGRLVVATAEAEVIVHGTRFVVEQAAPEETAVRVHEGLVEVRPLGGRRPSVFLRPGGALTVPGARRYLQELSRGVEDLVARRSCDARVDVAAYLDNAPPDRDVSAALYLKGSCALLANAAVEALSAFERAAAVSADPTRADNALARAAQIQAQRGAAEGAAAWRRYLQRFPNGLHRDMAEKFLAAPAGR